MIKVIYKYKLGLLHYKTYRKDIWIRRGDRYFVVVDHHCVFRPICDIFPTQILKRFNFNDGSSSHE